MENKKEIKIGTRGRSFVGRVISDKMQKTITVQWERKFYIPKYERHEKRLSKVKARNPDNINAKKGDLVRVAECRPLAKTVNFIVLEKFKETK